MKLRKSRLQTEHVHSRNSVTRSRNSNNRKKAKSAPTSTGVERNRARVTRVCFMLVLVFLICWCPFYAVHMAKMVGMQGTVTTFTITLEMTPHMKFEHFITGRLLQDINANFHSICLLQFRNQSLHLQLHGNQLLGENQVKSAHELTLFIDTIQTIEIAGF